jgi:stage II sporulation protein D
VKKFIRQDRFLSTGTRAQETVLIIMLCALAVFCAAPASAMDIPDKIRVSVASNADSIELSVRGGYSIVSSDNGRLLDKGHTFFNRKIEPAVNGISFGKNIFNANSIDIIPKEEPSIYFNKRLYRGILRIAKTRQQKLVAVNEINLEDYIKGVLYHEVSHRWPMEAIKAQAIASRTYAFYQVQENAHRHYHLYSDVSSQVYNGVYAERYRTNSAVDQTKGRVLLWKGKPVPAFFHSTCGGHTENASSLWKVDLPPLAGTECSYCKNSPHFSWDYDMEIGTLEEALKSAGYMVGSSYSVNIVSRNRSRRVDSVIIKGHNYSESIKAKDLRHLVGPLLLKSTNFNVSVKNGRIYFKGKGWGHGVGMCQWGAFAMAKKKKTADEILAYYYPGAKVTRLTSKK